MQIISFRDLSNNLIFANMEMFVGLIVVSPLATDKNQQNMIVFQGLQSAISREQANKFQELLTRGADFSTGKINEKDESRPSDNNTGSTTGPKIVRPS